MKTIIAFLTVSIIVLATFVMKQKNMEPEFTKTAQTDASGTVTAYNVKTVAAAPKNEIMEVRKDAPAAELTDAVRRKDKEAALAIVSRIIKEKRDEPLYGTDGNYGDNRSFRAFEEDEEDEEDDN